MNDEKTTKKWVAVADKKSIERLNAWIDEGAVISDMGDCYVSLDAGGFSYMGATFRVRHPEIGDHVAILSGNNCRYWGTTEGRAEMAHGDKANAGSRDPAPGMLAPWHKLCVWTPVSNGWTPRQSKSLADLRIRVAESSKKWRTSDA